MKAKYARNRRGIVNKTSSITIRSIVVASILLSAPLISKPSIVYAADNEIAIIGDSLFSINHRSMSRKLSSLLGDEEIIDRSVSGSKTACPPFALLCKDIAESYQEIKSEGYLPNLKTIVVNGGANDWLVPNRTARVTRRNIRNLLQEIREDGIENIIFVRYYTFADWLRGVNEYLSQVMEHEDASLEDMGIRQFCENNDIIYVDLRHVIYSGTAEYPGGIHPSPAGSQVIAHEVYNALFPFPCGDKDGDGVGDACESSYSAVANAEASTYGERSLTVSGSFNTLALLIIPVGAVITLRFWRKKR